jgi:hypothetical protein
MRGRKFWHIALGLFLIYLGVLWMDWLDFSRELDVAGIAAIVVGALVLVDQ